jgi:hypothetical protein
VDDTLDKFGNKDSKSWTNEKKEKIVRPWLKFSFIFQIIFCKIIWRRTLQLLYGSG